MTKAILKRRLNFMTAISNANDRICNIPKGIEVSILKEDGKLAFILWKKWSKWINAKHYLKAK